ncbi:hypothetical protein PC358_04655 [Pseudomonas capeferrum]|nr:hypothetical protein PC358_04655 [Pseudomonas capeferrum]
MEESLVVLFLKESAYPALIGWDDCRGKLDNRQIVPFIECGIQGGVPISDTYGHLRVDKPFDENAKLMAEIYARIRFASHLKPD